MTLELFTDNLCTVDTLITGGVFRRGAVLAGSSGLKRPLRMVSVIEVPDIADWVHPGELLITTAFAFKDNVKLLADLVATFADQGLAGLAIKPRRFLSDLSSAILQQADSKGFPIIEVDPHVTYGDLLKQISEMILSNNVASQTQFLEVIYKELTRALVDQNGLEGLGTRLAKILRRPAMIESPGAGRQYFAPQGMNIREVEPLFAQVLWHRSMSVNDHAVVYAMGPRGGTYACAVQVRVGDGLRNKGSVYVLDSDPTASDVIIKSTEYAASLAAVEMIRIETVQKVNQHYRNTFMAEWLDGRVTDRRQIIDRGRQCGWQLEQDHWLIMVRSPNTEPILDDAASVVGPDAIVCPKGRDLIILVPESTGGSASDAVAMMLQKHGINRENVLISDSVGPVPSENMAATYQEMAELLEVGEAIGALGRITRESLGIYALWPLIPDKQKLREFLWKNLSSVILYDQSHHTQLMETLEAFLDARGNVTATAKRLFVHYNTVLYRLKKVDELTPMRFLDSDEGQLLLHVAVKFWAVSDRPIH